MSHATVPPILITDACLTARDGAADPQKQKVEGISIYVFHEARLIKCIE